jgi:hypothetical protein
MVSSSTCLISIEPTTWSPSVHRYDVKSTTPVVKPLDIQRYLPFNHITSHTPFQDKVRRFYSVCIFYVASRAFVQELFLNYEHETTTLIIYYCFDSPLRALHCRCHIHYSWRNMHLTSHFCTVQAVRQAWNQSRVKRVKSVFGPLESNYATDINKYTLKGNNNTINARMHTMHSNRTSILRIYLTLIPLLGFGADNKNLMSYATPIAQEPI